jgi:uncharacterized membrane protein YeaQ/YmgE (transglycosylase-associated protein family)
MLNSFVSAFGAICFGVVVGWVTYRTLRRAQEGAAISDIASVIGAVGGTTVTGLFKDQLFGWYAIGFAAGFFSFYILSILFASLDPEANAREELLIGREPPMAG